MDRVGSMAMRTPSDPLQAAAQRHATSQRVAAMIEQLRALIEGRRTRAQVEDWARALAVGLPYPTVPFPGHGRAHLVWASLVNAHERHDEGEIVRLGDLRAYLDWLTRGESFVGVPEQLVGLPISLDALAERTGTTPVRSWCEGLGWMGELRFGATLSGRPFVAFGDALGAGAGTAIHERKGDPWHEALIDLFETFAIDERDTTQLREDVDLAQLPVWSFWREDDNANRFEIERFRSYAKAEAQVELFRARGHRQFYWVEPARD